MCAIHHTEKDESSASDWDYSSFAKTYGLVTFEALAKHLSPLGVSRAWLDELVRAGQIPCCESYNRTRTRAGRARLIRLFDPEAVMRALRACCRVQRKGLCSSRLIDKVSPIDAAFVDSLPRGSPDGGEADVGWVLDNISDEILGFHPRLDSCPSRRAYNLLVAVESDPALRSRFLSTALDSMARGRSLNTVLKAVGKNGGSGSGSAEEAAEPELSSGDAQTRRLTELLIGTRGVNELSGDAGGRS